MKPSETFSIYSAITKEIGQVVEIRKQVAFVSGLPNARIMDLVIFSRGQKGYVVELSENAVEVVLLDYPIPEVSEAVTRTFHPLGVHLDANESYQNTDMFLGLDLESHPPEIKLIPIDSPPPPIKVRSKIKTPLNTNIAAIDTLIPLGKGQRQLLIGDRSTGKTTTALQIAQSVALQGYKTIVCLIGKRANEIMLIKKQLEAHPQSYKNISLVTSGAYEPVGKIIMTPLSAMTLAEHFVQLGQDVVVIFDDLTFQANFYRELALIRGSFPGKESFPGDIFNFQAKLLERAGNFVTNNGENSITVLPIVNATGGSLAGFIQTNLMSITDGHLFFDPELFFDGIRPPINQFYSVTRVGRQTQNRLTQELANIALKILHDYAHALEFSKFGSQIAQKTQENLVKGKQLQQILTQSKDILIPFNLQLFLLGITAFSTRKKINVKQLVHRYFNDKVFLKQLHALSESGNLKDFRHLLNQIEL